MKIESVDAIPFLTVTLKFALEHLLSVGPLGVDGGERRRNHDRDGDSAERSR